MKTARRKSGRRGPLRRGLRFESLEARVVLDGHLGAADIDTPAQVAEFAQFNSAEDLQQFLVDTAVDRWKDLFGTTITHWPYLTDFVDRTLHSVTRHPELVPRSADAALEQVAGLFDGTNIQVHGVDEGDLVKTDGEYLYIASQGNLTIIDARNPAELTLAAEIPLDSHAGEMFVSGDRLVLLTNQFAVGILDIMSVRDAWWPGEGAGPQTTVAIYDIADRTSPKLVQKTDFDATVTASRRIDDLVYLVMSSELQLPRPLLHCETSTSEHSIDAAAVNRLVADLLPIRPPIRPEHPRESCVYETEHDYVSRVTDDIVALAMPSFETTDSNGALTASGLITEPADTYKPLTDDTSSVTSIVVLDLSAETSGIAAATGLLTDYSSTVYASAQNIYVASNTHDHQGHSSTTLQQFAIGADAASIELSAVGVVPGTLLNQFAMDEFEGYLRVVTSSGWGSDRTNQLYVLEPRDAHLEVVGTIEQIAAGETVFAVRFLGDEAFVVTFRVIDPLFTIDLSDPAHPAIVGELKIPGFSNYLHPVSPDLLLGLGRDEGRLGDVAQLSLLDVSDFQHPERIDKFVFERASWTEAFYNHHAISYFPDSQIVVIPFHGFARECLDGADSGVCRREPVNAFWVIQVELDADEKSLQLLGKIEHQDAPLRSLRIGDNLFTVSTSGVKATRLLEPDTLVGELYFGTIAFTDYVTIDSSDPKTELDVLRNDRVDHDAIIVAVSEAATGAVVEISADGKQLWYTPAAHSDATRDFFDYTVQSGTRQETATVHVRIEHKSVEDHMVRLAKAHLIERLGREDASHQIRVRSIQPREWPNSCLGVEGEHDFCAEVITPGFKIVFEYALTEFVYHTDTTQQVVAVNDPVIEQSALIQIRAEVVDASGERVTSLLVGQQAVLQIHADDLRADARGVFAAYVDIRFDPAQVGEIGPIHHGTDFSHGVTGTIVDDRGLVDETGGFNDEPHAASTLVVSIPFVAASPGELRFSTQAADKSPEHDSLLLGVNSPIPVDRMRFGEIVVEVVDSLHNAADPTDANMDGEMTPLDALVIMNHLNRYGAGPVNAHVARVLRTAAGEAQAAGFAADVNRDGYISPIDVLLIINALDVRSRLRAEGEAGEISPPSPTVPMTPSFITPGLVTADRAAWPIATEPQSPSRDSVRIARHVDHPHPPAEAFQTLARSIAERPVKPGGSLAEDRFFAELGGSNVQAIISSFLAGENRTLSHSG